MSFDPILAIDHSYVGTTFGVLTSAEVITTFEVPKFKLELSDFAKLAKKYKTKHFMLTGPQVNFLPAKSDDFIFEKRNRLEALTQGIHFLAREAPALIIIFELGCHLFYHSEETVYLGSLPYTFSSFGLEEDISVSTEMGSPIPEPLHICSTHALPQTRVMDRYETLLAYTIALGIKEFQSRYQIKTVSISGHITAEQKALLVSFLLPESPSTDNASLLELPFSSHLAIFGMLSPYLETDAGKN